MICKAATDGTYTLFIEYDDDPINPREDYDNFGSMVCFHRRHSLGDKHHYSEPAEMLKHLLDHPRFSKPVFDYIKRGRSGEVRIEYDKSEREWQLLSYGDFSKTWYIEAAYPPGLKSGNEPSFLDAALDVLSPSAMLEILNVSQNIVLLPLFLYDHGGITMSTSNFACTWDSGQVGWIYADPDRIEKEYGKITKDTIAKATARLEAEVLCYDLYITGQCYGFRLYDGECEIDSCWGFLGAIDDMAEELRGYLPSECQHLIDALSDCWENDVAHYFWNRKRDAC